MIRSALLSVTLCASSAFAIDAWTINWTAGSVVMDEVTPLTFRVTNAANATQPIRSFTLGFPVGNYDIDGASAPAGWRATEIDRQNRKVTFRVNDACTITSNGLAPGQSALFEVRLVGVPATADVLNEALTTNFTGVLDVCNRNQKYANPGGASTWSLIGLSARLTTTARAMKIGDQVSVSLTITNTSAATQSGLAPTAPVLTGSATFLLLSGPTPGLVNSLALDSSATFTWVYRATGDGAVRFSSSARNTAVSSLTVSSLDVNVGAFPAAVLATPATIISGEAISLLVLPTNNASSPLTNVLPLPPTVTATGTGSATLLTAAAPSSIPSLGADSTSAFTSTWTIRGDPGDKVTFQARAQATNALGGTVVSAPVSSAEVTLSELTVRPSPSSVLSGAPATQIRYTISNGSPLAITSVVMMTPDATLFWTPAAGSLPAGWTSSGSNKPRGIKFDATTTAARILQGQSQTFTINYASIGTAAVPTPTSHKAHVIYSDGTTARGEGTVTVAVNRAVPDVTLPMALSSSTRTMLTWSNPALHDGVLVIRSAGSPPDTAPTPGRNYTRLEMLGNATVAYVDPPMSFNSSFTDASPLTPGTRYYYRIYNRDEFGLYSPGNTPTASPNNYLLVIPPGTAATEPVWCITVGLPALQQPFTDLGRAVYQSTNASFFTGTLISGQTAFDGNEKWRPSLTQGVVQARPTVSNGALYVGDQLGFAYRLSAATGAISWTGNGGFALGDVIQAQSVVVPRAFTSAAFQAAYPADMAIFATRNNTNRSNNSVWGLRADTGAQLFSYQPGNLDQVTGAPIFDFINNRLWVASMKTGGPSLRVLNLLNPTAAPLLLVTDMGDIPAGVARQTGVNQMIAVDETGLARGYSVTTLMQVWQTSIGAAVTSPLVVYQNDFFASTSTDVRRFTIDPTTNAVTMVWTSPSIPSPTSVRVDAVSGILYAGDAQGRLWRLNLGSGTQAALPVQVSTIGGVSMPSFDSTAGLKRVYVGTEDGRLCAYPP